MTPRRALAALALVFALAHVPFLASSLEDIDSVNFALGIRRFDVAKHRPHPPGYPVYIAIGKAATGAAHLAGLPEGSSTESRVMAVLSLLAGLSAIGLLYAGFACLRPAGEDRLAPPWNELDLTAIGATAVTVASPLFWYLAVRPMSDLPGFAVALTSQACLLLAWWRQTPAADGDRRLQGPAIAASGRMMVAGAFLAALSIGLRSQTVWYTMPLLALVLADRIGRGVAGALIGSAMTFTLGGLLWGIPLLVASGGLGPYLAALGTQAGEDFAAGEMLYRNPNPRAAAFALWHTFVDPWDSPALATIVLALAAFGLAQVALRDRRTLAALIAMSGPYLAFHVVFQDTSFVRYALPLVPVVAFLAMKAVAAAAERAVPVVAAAITVWAVVIAGPVLMAYGAEPSPTVRVLAAMRAEARTTRPGALAMHQTFVRPLEAEDVGIDPQLASPPRREWLEALKYWREGKVDPLWFLADPSRTDLALIDPQSLRDATEFRWSLVARPAFGGMRPSAVRWYRMTPPGWFCEEGWALTPETSGMATMMGRRPHLGPITAWVRRRAGSARVIVGGRNLAGSGQPTARFILAIDDVLLQTWDAAPGFFLHVFDVPAGRLSGAGSMARLTIHSTAVTGTEPVPTAIEQFDLQDEDTLMWGYDQGWQEAEYVPSFGVWRWASERATLRIVGPAAAVRVTLPIESPLRYFDQAPHVRVMAGDRELAVSTVSKTIEWTVDVPADALAASGGLVTIETDRVFVPADRGGSQDRRHLGLRILGARVSNSLTPREVTR